MNPEMWTALAADASEMHDVLYAAAHEALKTDLLVTTSPTLRRRAITPWGGLINVYSPTEAAKIVGLFLRSRGVYAYTAGPNHRGSCDRWMFYHVLSRHRLPGLWRYLAACVHSERHRRDDIVYLGQSVLVRARRALEQRDRIGFEFYKKQSNNTRDTMMSDLEYWSLLVMGALDAMARVAHRAFRLPGSERNVSFRRMGFRGSLRKHGGSALADAAESEHASAFIDLVSGLRNTIHGASFQPVGVLRPGEPETSRIRVLDSDAAEMLQAAGRLGDPVSLGLETRELLLEPYSFVFAMTDLFYRIVNELAASTEVERLLPPTAAVSLVDGPSASDRVFRTRAETPLGDIGIRSPRPH